VTCGVSDLTLFAKKRGARVISHIYMDYSKRYKLTSILVFFVRNFFESNSLAFSSLFFFQKMVQMDATESPPSSREEEEQIEPSLRPRRTRGDVLNPENVREEKLRSKDVLDDVLNAVGVLLSFFFLNLFPPFALGKILNSFE